MNFRFAETESKWTLKWNFANELQIDWNTPSFLRHAEKRNWESTATIDHSKKDIKSCIVNQNNWYPCGITPYGSTVMEYQNEQQKTAAGRQNDPIFQVSWSIASCFKKYVHTTLQDDQSVAQGNVVWYVCHLNCKIYISSCIVGLMIFTLDSIITYVLAYTHIYNYAQ